MIVKVDMNNFEEVLPLITEYQEFYGVENIDSEKNRKFFSIFAKDNEHGILHMYKLEDSFIGFTTIYKTLSSTRAEEVAVLNDLFIKKKYRGHGYGKALIDNAMRITEEKGFSRLQWLTAEENKSAQALYSKTGASQSRWYFYTKDL